MGVSIWYVPDGNDRAVKIDLGSNLTDLDANPDDLVLASESIGGASATAMFRSRLRVRIELANFTSASLEREIMTLQTHLNRGGSMALALVESKAWAGYTASTRPARTQTLVTRGNTWSFGQTAALVALDEVVVWGGSPEGNREYTTASSVSGSTVVVTDALRFGYGQGPLLVRHRWYFPALRRPVDDRTPILTSPNRRNQFTFSMDAIEDVAMLAEAASWSPGVLPTTTGNGRALGPDVLFKGIQAQPASLKTR